MFDSIVYIHGFDGSTKSPKVAELKKAFPKTHVVAPEYDDHDADASHRDLSAFIHEHHKKHPHTLIVGTSLGGFWAHRLSNEHKLPSLLINPSTHPTKTLKKWVGGNFTQHHVDAFKRHEHHPMQKPKAVYEPRSVILAKNDEVIDHKVAHGEYKGHAHVHVTETGGHRYDQHHEMINAVKHLGNTFVERQ